MVMPISTGLTSAAPPHRLWIRLPITKAAKVTKGHSMGEAVKAPATA